MQEIKELFTQIQDNPLFYGLGAIVSVFLILALRYLVLHYIQKATNKKKTAIFFKTIVNWITAFTLIVYLISYFQQSSLLYKTLFTFGETNITLFLLLTLTFASVLAFKLSKMIQDYILPIFYERYEVDIGSQASINTFSKYFIITITILIILSSIGFDLTSLTVLASVLGVGIGFGLKNVMSNFISGLIILFERPIKVSDRVIVDGTIATVEEIKIRATIVRTRKNERLIIPNAYFLENQFTNRSFDSKKLRVSINVGVSYDSDVELVEKLLIESVQELKEEKWPDILDEPKARVFFEEFADSSLNFSLWFWINSQTDEREFLIPSDLRFKIMKKFREENVEIPFPQRDLHLYKKDSFTI